MAATVRWSGRRCGVDRRAMGVRSVVLCVYLLLTLNCLVDGQEVGVGPTNTSSDVSLGEHTSLRRWLWRSSRSWLSTDLGAMEVSDTSGVSG